MKHPLVLALALSPACKSIEYDVIPEEPPHILLVVLDDVNVNSLGLYMDTDGDGVPDDDRSYADTPTLDALCQGGVMFEEAWSAPVGAPTRASMLTGRYGHRTGIGGVLEDNQSLSVNESTLPQLLDSAGSGYNHAQFGRWGLGTEGLGDASAPNTMGWSHFAGSLDALVDVAVWERTVDGVTETVTGYPATVTVDDALAWFGQQPRDVPWFSWLAFNAPRAPHHLPPAALHSLDLTGAAEDIQDNPEPYYRAALEAVDTELGRLLGELDGLGMQERVVIVVGDNGTPNEAVVTPYPPRRAKGTLYQGGVHVPLCIAGAGVEGPGRRSGALVHTADLFGAVLQLAGVSLGEQLPEELQFDSVSLLPLLVDDELDGLRTHLYTEHFGPSAGAAAGAAMRDDLYKLIQFEDGVEELFLVAGDDRERVDLIENGQLTDDAEVAYWTMKGMLEE